MSEGAAIPVLPALMADAGRLLFDRNFDVAGEDMGGFHSCLEAVQFLLLTYAKDQYIERFLVEKDVLRQESSETETMYHRPSLKKACDCAGVFTDMNVITRFIRGLLSALNPLGKTFDPRRTATLMHYVDFANAKGDAPRALGHATTKSSSKSKTSKRAKKPACSSRALPVY